MLIHDYVIANVYYEALLLPSTATQAKIEIWLKLIHFFLSAYNKCHRARVDAEIFLLGSVL